MQDADTMGLALALNRITEQLTVLEHQLRRLADARRFRDRTDHATASSSDEKDKHSA